MTQWHVELTCKRPKLLTYLSTTLQEPGCTVVAGNTDCYHVNPGSQPALAARKTSGYYLLSSEFDSLTDVSDVHSRAMVMVPFLNAVVKLRIGVYWTPIGIDDVFRPDTQGRMIWEIATVTTAFSSLESRLQKAAGQPLNFAAIWLLAQKHPEVEDALRHLANETNWFNLYKVYEIIAHEVGEKMLDTWSHGRIEDFTYSANNAHASGYSARHSSVKFKPSPKRQPLTITEGADLIADLFLQWLRNK